MSTASGSPERGLARLLLDPAVRRVTALWAGWVVLLLLFQAAAGLRLDVVGPDTSYGWTVEHSTDTPRRGIGLSHVRWDSYHYLRLAQFGYHRAEDAAYYPAYPLLMRVVTEAITRPLMPWASALQQFAVAGLAISIVATLPATWALHALAREVLGHDDDALRCGHIAEATERADDVAGRPHAGRGRGCHRVAARERHGRPLPRAGLRRRGWRERVDSGAAGPPDEPAVDTVVHETRGRHRFERLGTGGGRQI